MNEQVYLGVDLGAESGRVTAGRWNGRSMHLEEIHRFPNGGIEIAGTLRWDVLRLWSEISKGLSLAGQRFGSAVKSIGVDTWGLDFVLLSRSDELLGLPFHYRDARTRSMIERAAETMPRAEIFANSGIQFMEINSLYQLLALRDRSPEILEAADVFLTIPDYINWCLTGVRGCEFTNATTTQIVHPVTRNWSGAIVEGFGLPTRIFPEIITPGTTLGPARAGLAGVPVIAPATHDTGSAVVAVPMQGHCAYLSSGTWSLLGVELPAPVLSEAALRYNVTNEGGVDGTTRLLKNIMGLWLVQQSRRAFSREYDYATLVQIAADAPSLRSLVDPDAPRFLNPPDMPAEIRAFCRETNQPVPEDDGSIVRCALESLALKYSVVLGRLEELTGWRAETIHVVGGGAQNDLLNQFTANACERVVVAGPVEATVLGNLLMQVRSCGELASLSQIREASRASSELNTYEPARNASATWKDARNRFTRLLV